MCDRSADCLANQIIWSLAGDFYVLLKLKQVFADLKKKKKRRGKTQGFRKIQLKDSVLNIHTPPLLATDSTIGLGRGCIWTRHIFYCLTYCRGRHQKFAFITTHNYSGSLFPFKPKIPLIMNDLKATVILIRCTKYSNQMEAGPGALGAGLGGDLSFSLALMLTNPGGSWLWEAVLRATHGPGSGTHRRRHGFLAARRPPRLALRSWASGAPGEREEAAPRAVRPARHPQQHPHGHPGHSRSAPVWLCAPRLAALGREGAAGGAQIARTPAEARSSAVGEGLSLRKSRVDFGF